MKRFYEQVNVVGIEGRYHVTLDDKPVKTPARRDIHVSEALASLLAEEWARQGETIQATAMTTMRLVATAIDRIADNPAAALAEFRSYAGSDLLCYRSPEPRELVHRQQALWDPILDWARQRYDVSFELSNGIMPVPQPEETLNRLERAAGHDELRLSGLIYGCHMMGSAVLALALAEGEIAQDQAHSLSCLDHLYQLETWGEDAEERRRLDQILLELESLNRYFRSLVPA